MTATEVDYLSIGERLMEANSVDVHDVEYEGPILTPGLAVKEVEDQTAIWNAMYPDESITAAELGIVDEWDIEKHFTGTHTDSTEAMPREKAVVVRGRPQNPVMAAEYDADPVAYVVARDELVQRIHAASHFPEDHPLKIRKVWKQDCGKWIHVEVALDDIE